MSNTFPGTMTNGIGFKRIREDGQVYWSEVTNVDVTYAPASLATVTGSVSAAFPVDGAALGDRVNVFPPYSLQGVIATGFVDTAGNVKFSLFNPTGATVALASGTWRIQVVKQ